MLPKALLTLMGLFNPLLRELKEMGFLWDRPCVLDDSKYTRRFGGGATSLEEGLQKTLDWYREASPSS